MPKPNQRQLETQTELERRGDLATLAGQGLTLTIEPDGVAWADSGSVEICLHHDRGWLPHVRSCQITGRHVPLAEAIAAAERYVEIDRRVERSAGERILDKLYRRGWPRGHAEGSSQA